MSILTDKSNDEFVNYLRMVATDYADSGCDATAEDYREAADRIEEIGQLKLSIEQFTEQGVL